MIKDILNRYRGHTEDIPKKYGSNLGGTRCTYYEQYTTEEALQAAAKSYKGLTGDI